MIATSREPLLQKATLVAVATVVFTVLGLFGVQVRPDLRDAIMDLVAVLAPLAPLAVVWLARGHVTPVADPRDHTGAALVPVTPASPDGDPDAAGTGI